jgi:hypothetical protein
LYLSAVLSGVSTRRQPVHSERPPTARWTRTQWLAVLIVLTLATLCMHGYHPLAEDGGLYAAGIEYLLDPTLFPHYTAFVQEHLRFSLFAPAVASVVRYSHLSMLWCLFLLNLLSIWFTLFSALQIVRRMTQPTQTMSDGVQAAAVALFAAWWTIPVAGTSLLMMDPYVTARSFSTPFTLLAMAYALDWSSAPPASPRSTSRRSPPRSLSTLAKIACCLAAAATMHPLMAAYALACVVMIGCWRIKFSRRQSELAIALCLALALGAAAWLQAAAAPESPALHAAILTRYYWFLSQWQWYELAGIVGPLGVFWALLRYRAHGFAHAFAVVCRASITLCLASVAVAILFARENLSVHSVARLQPLRILLPVYALMALLLGLCMQQWLEGAHARLRVLAPAICIGFIACIMCFVQRQTFRLSPHVELPWRAERTYSPWAQAFLWARANTPRNALFALDAKYVNMDGEDAQTFRATSLRSALPDYSKDGGEAAITPALAETWQAASEAQQHLSMLDEATRAARLKPFHVTWTVLRSEASTALSCPYDNGTVKVCRLN